MKRIQQNVLLTHLINLQNLYGALKPGMQRIKPGYQVN